jgi:hypothetical protein
MPDIAVDAAIPRRALRLRDAVKTCYTCRGDFILCFQRLLPIGPDLSRPHLRRGI